MAGSGIDTRSLPFLPIISPRLMYFDRLLLTFPRTSLRNRWRSCSIFCPTVVASVDGMGHRIWESYQTGGVRVKRSREAARAHPRVRVGSRDVRRRGMEGWGCPEPHAPALMAA